MVTNSDRANWAGQAVVAHNVAGHAGVARNAASCVYGLGPELQLLDLLCNLQHWADCNGVDFAVALKNAQGIYAEEKQEEQDNDTN